MLMAQSSMIQLKWRTSFMPSFLNYVLLLTLSPLARTTGTDFWKNFFLPVICLRFQRTPLHFLIPLSHKGKLGKCSPLVNPPGPEWLTNLYYQTFSDLLIPKLTAFYNTFLMGYLISDNMLHSYITLIPKPGKNPLDCSNYRPIALSNSNLNIFTKILANRLAIWLPQLVHKDQVGFVPCRQGR